MPEFEEPLVPGGESTLPQEVLGEATPAAEIDEKEQKFVADLIAKVKEDKKHWGPSFKAMQDDMQFAKDGADKSWIEAKKYVANVTGRHVNRKVAALYAKNPKVVARRRPRCDFQIWDENPQTLMEAYSLLQTMAPVIQQAEQAAAMMPPTMDPMTGTIVPPPAPMLPPEVLQAQALLEDVAEGLRLRVETDKLGKTMEVLFSHAMQEQQPVDFKTAMKQAVRRASTTGVAYGKLAFQRIMQPELQSSGMLDDQTQQFDHIRRLSEEQAEGKLEGRDVDQQELALTQQGLSQRGEIILREGLVFDWPESTRVIPDKLCRHLVGFIGCRRVTVEYLYTPDEVKELFGVDLERGKTGGGPLFTPYTTHGPSTNGESADQTKEEDGGLVCVWETFDKPSGNAYYTCDGYKGFLKPPGPPDVLVEGFYPIEVLTFNEVEHPTAVFPPSDVRLMRSPQIEFNALRQGGSEHRKAARPRFAHGAGAFGEGDKEKLGQAEAFDVIEINLPPDRKIGDILGVIPVPGYDPNLYNTAEAYQDIQVVVGASEAWFGSPGKATATGEALAQGSTDAGVEANIDDLDSFLTRLTRKAGQIMLRNMSPEQVAKIAGRGAFWPPMPLADIFEEVALEIEAGSSGKPNQAQEAATMEKLLPVLIQIPGISPQWIAKKLVQALDAHVDLTEAYVEGLPSIISQNRSAQPAPGDPNADPAEQGEEGGDNGPPAPGGPAGTDAPMGNNQV